MHHSTLENNLVWEMLKNNPGPSDDRLPGLISARMHIAKAQAEAGMIKEARENFAEVLAAVKEIANGAQFGITIPGISVAQAEAGIVDDAIITAEKIDDNENRWWALIAIAKAQAKAGMVAEAKEAFDQALNSAQKIKANDERAQALRNIATFQIDEGMLDEALITAKK